MGDHDDHIHVGWRPSLRPAGSAAAGMRRGQWLQLNERLNALAADR
jgi:hypothetical protein